MAWTNFDENYFCPGHQINKRLLRSLYLRVITDIVHHRALNVITLIDRNGNGGNHLLNCHQFSAFRLEPFSYSGPIFDVEITSISHWLIFTARHKRLCNFGFLCNLVVSLVVFFAFRVITTLLYWNEFHVLLVSPSVGFSRANSPLIWLWARLGNSSLAHSSNANILSNQIES